MSSKVLLSVFAVVMLVFAAVCVGVSRNAGDAPAGLLQVDNPPYEQTNASADPSTIWVETSPPGRDPKETRLTLTLEGLGVPVKEYRPQDVVFLIDASWSMLENDPSGLRLEAAKHYVDLLNSSDRAAVVAFNRPAWLVGGDHLSSNFPHIKDNIDSITLAYYTNLYDPIRIATDELLARGDGSHVWVEILLTDGDDTTGHTMGQILSQADRAAYYNITIFTIGLIGTGGVNEPLLKMIANATKGEYMRAENASVLEKIYENISKMVKYPDTAGRDNNVDAVLPDYVHYIAGSAVPAPSFAGMYGGAFHVMWNFSKLRINETWTAAFNVTSGLQGANLHALSYPETAVRYTQYNDTRTTVPFPETFIDVLGNWPPVADAGGPYHGYEGGAVTFDASGSSDQDGDPLTYRWDFESDGTWDTPWMTDATFDRVWGDDFVGNATLEVSDGSYTDTDTAVVEILNVPPSLVGQVEAHTRGSLVLRVAGEKWHDVIATVYLNGGEKYTGRVVRTPGSPDDQAVTLGDVEVDLMSGDEWSAKVVYTPLDDPINGQVWGADPAWLIFRTEHGDEGRLHHTFNVRHSETWTWDVPDLRAVLVGVPLDFQATATDPGSDDLTFTWDWGDGTPATATTYYNDGIGPDPYPSPGGTFPFTATDACTHSYSMTGTFTVTLKVNDDDGGASEVTFVVDMS